MLTGGAGFIGSHLIQRLVAKNQLVVFDNFHRNALKETQLSNHANVEVRQGDVLDAQALGNATRGCDAVVHMASIAGVDTVMKDPIRTMRVSLLGTANALEAAATTKTVKRFIDFSTSEVFGRYAFNATEAGVTTLGAVGEARWTYAVSKLATEHLAMSYFRQHALQACSIRPFNIYGPGQVGEGAIHRFIVRALHNEPLEIHNDGSQIRSWCYVDDIVDGVLLCLTRDEAVGEAFNIGNPRSTLTTYNLAREIVRLARSQSAIQFVRWDFADVELRIPSIDKAREKLGYEPHVDLEEGLLRTIQWYRSRMANPVE